MDSAYKRAIYDTDRVTMSRYLARFEMDEIKTSRWKEAFSAIAEMRPVPPTIRLFFGRNDHWVGNEQRDAFIETYCGGHPMRSFSSSSPSSPFVGRTLDITADIDPSRDGDEGSVVIPHDFSIRKDTIYPLHVDWAVV